MRPNSAAISIALIVAALCCAAGAQNPAPAPELHPSLRPLPFEHTGPFTRNGDGDVVCIEGQSSRISADGGTTWQSHALFADAKMSARPELALITTRKGTLVCLFLDDLDKNWKWNSNTNAADGDAWLYVYCTRSADGGKTWSSPVRVQDGYCGAIRDLIETKDGHLVTPLQKYLPEHARHATTPFISLDDGVSWQPAGLLDIGGRGHHDGSIEPTLVELRDGRLWMLLRTCNDVLYQSFSTDGGKSWGELSPTNIDASSSPAIVKRLASGRLVLAWNRLYPEGKTEYPRRAGQHSQRAASWHREELSLAFSEDDGATWTPPVVVARTPGKRVAYPYLFEFRPGVIWLTTMQGGLRAEFHEKDFVGETRRSESPRGGLDADGGTAFNQDERPTKG